MYAPTGFMWLIWTGVIVIAVLAIILISATVYYARRGKADRMSKGVWCRKCGYSLRGHPGPPEHAKCPECGADLTVPYAIQRHGE